MCGTIMPSNSRLASEIHEEFFHVLALVRHTLDTALQLMVVWLISKGLDEFVAMLLVA